MDPGLEGTQERTAPGRIPAGIWVLGFVSLLMDVSSEMIHSLLPLFMVTTLGASALTVGRDRGAGRGDGARSSRCSRAR